MKINVRHENIVHRLDVSKAMMVLDFRALIKDKFDVEPAQQRLIYSGKILNDGNDLQDYKIMSGHTISLMKRVILGEVSGNKPQQPETPVFKDEIDPDAEETAKQGATNTQSMEDIMNLCPELAKEIKLDAEKAEDEEPPCKVCKDNSRRKCRECGCTICGGKDRPEVQLFCEECQYVTHMSCLKPPLEKIPEEDWYCPDCFNNKDEIIQGDQKVGLTKKTSKMPSRIAKESNKKIRDWGKGEGCSGRRKVCTKVPPHHFGPIPGIDVGMNWQTRMQLSEEGIHRPPVSGIAGKPDLGAQSLVLSGGYEDDVDNGDEFYYTGAGGRDLSNNKRTGAPVEDQKFEKVNKALAKCCAAPLDGKKGATAKNWKEGLPIRVCRSYKSKKHSEFAPEKGYRYDGIYKVLKYWPQKSDAHSFIVYRYLLRRDDPEPAPWSKGAKVFEMIKRDPDEEPKSKKRKAKDDSDNTTKKCKLEMFVVSNEWLAAMDKDEKNGKLWKECQNFEADTKLKWLDNVELLFECTVCRDLLHKPITTECNHNMCFGCYQRALKLEKVRCPVCRGDISETLEINKNCMNALNILFPGYSAGRD